MKPFFQPQLRDSLEDAAQRLEPEAERHQDSIEAYRREAMTNRKLSLLQGKRYDLRVTQRQLRVLRALSEMHERGEDPGVLSFVKTRSQVQVLLSGIDWDRLDRRERRLLEQAYVTNELLYDRAGREAEALAGPMVDEKTALLEEKLDFVSIPRRIPGFFPTPRELAEELVHLARIGHGDAVLEPSAGRGDIAEVVRELYPNAALYVVERQYDLREILTLKGFDLVDVDFLEHQDHYDRIIMNPPFERGEDIEHVIHAWTLLRPGGRLVSIMGVSYMYNNGSAAKIFRRLLDSVSAVTIPNKSDAFRPSGTGVRTVTVVMDKEG